MSQIFEFRRFVQLVVRQLVMQYKPLIIGFSTYSLFTLLIITLQTVAMGGDFSAAHFLGFVMPFFFIGGYLITSRSFQELSNPHRGYLYLMLPATTFEKLLSTWVIGSVLFVIVGIINLTVVNYLTWQISTVFGGGSVEWVDLLSPKVLKLFSIYLATQPVFLLGAITFRKVHFLKTMLSVLVLNMGLAFFTAVSGFMLFRDSLKSVSSGVNNVVMFDSPNMMVLWKVLFWGVLPVLMLTVSYFKLKEREV